MVSPNSEVEERLGIPLRSTMIQRSKAYLKIMNHEGTPGKTDESFGIATTVPRLEND